MHVAKLVVAGILLFASGWVAGQAARPPADFMIRVDAPAGMTRVECVHGCELIATPSDKNPYAERMRSFVYQCAGESVQRCVGRASGWIVRTPAVDG